MLILNAPQPSQLPSESVNLPGSVNLSDDMWLTIYSYLKACGIRYNYHVPHIVYFCTVELLVLITGNNLG